MAPEAGAPAVTEVESTEARPTPWARPILGGLVAIIVLSLTVRLWAERQWSWFQDDWSYLERAASMPLVEYAFQNYNGHIMPLQFAVVWAITHIAPLEYGAAMIVLTLLMAASAVCWTALLLRIFGARPQVLLVTTMLVMTPLLVPPTLWWASGLQTYGLQAGMGATLLALHAYLQRGGSWRLLLVAVAYVAALGFWQKSLLITIPAAFLILVLPGIPRASSDQRRRVGAALGVVVVLSIAWAVLYLVLTAETVPGQARLGVPGADALLGFGLSAGLGMVIPGLLGGPWSTLAGLQDAYPMVPTWTQWTCFLAAVLVATFAVLCRRRGAWIIAMPVIYGMAMWSLVVGSERFGSLGQFAALDARYSSDLLPVLGLALAYAVTSTRAERENAGVPPAWRGPVPSGTMLVVGILGVLATAAITVSSLLTWSLAMDSLGPRTPRPWVDNLLASAQQIAPATVFNATAPSHVLAPAFFPDDARLERMLAPLGLPLTFDEPTQQLYVANGTGQFVESSLGVQARSLPGPVGNCGYLANPDGWTIIPLDDSLYAWNWGVRVTYFSETGGTMDIRVPQDEATTSAPPGFTSVTSVLVSSMENIGVRMREPGTGACVTEVQVGLVEPPPTVLK